MQLIDALSASSTGDFLELESGGKSFLGVDRKLEYFDDDFFSLVPEFTNILKVTSKSGVIQEELTELVVVLFRTKALLAETTRLQRDGYHAAWINNKELFIEAAENLNRLSDNFISSIESRYQK